MILKKKKKNTNFVFSTKRGLLVGHEYKTTVDKTAWNSVQRRPTNNCRLLIIIYFPRWEERASFESASRASI